MTEVELKTLLESSGYPVAYSHFKNSPSLPYIIFFRESKENISADLTIVGNWQYYMIWLCTEKRDLQAEKKVEDIIKQIDVDYTVTENYIDSEKIFQTSYQIKFLGR